MQGEVTTTNQSSSTSASPLLVVDNNSMNRIMLSRYITRLGYQATLVENGRQVQQLRIEIDQERSAREVAEINESDYFQQLLGKAGELRYRARGDQQDGMQENSAKKPDSHA